MTRRVFLVCATASAAWQELAPKQTPPAPSVALKLPPPKPLVLKAPSPAESAPKPGARLEQAGIHRKLPANSAKSGKWEKAAAPLWRWAVKSEGAKAIRLHLAQVNLGDGKLWIHDGRRPEAPFTGKGPNGDGEFWSGVLSGDTAIVEFQPAAKSKTLPFTVTEISHLFQE